MAKLCPKRVGRVKKGDGREKQNDRRRQQLPEVQARDDENGASAEVETEAAATVLFRVLGLLSAVSTSSALRVREGLGASGIEAAGSEIESCQNAVDTIVCGGRR